MPITIPRLHDRMMDALMSGADWAARWPAPAPDAELLKRAKVVAHRGAHGLGRPENSLAAFDAADVAGVWGIEFDVRFAADGAPVVSHDADLRRVFGQPIAVAENSSRELRARAAGLALFEEVAHRYGGRRHLMIEIKADGLPKGLAAEAFRDALASLEPGRDWHLLALRPEIFDAFPWAPPSALALVAELKPRAWSRIAIDRKLGALCGHFSLISPRMRERHLGLGQDVGVGQVASDSCLRREISRGANWLFTNRAEAAQEWLEEERRAALTQAP